MRFRFFIIWN